MHDFRVEQKLLLSTLNVYSEFSLREAREIETEVC